MVRLWHSKAMPHSITSMAGIEGARDQRWGSTTHLIWSVGDPLRSCTECSGCSAAQARQPRIYHSTTRWSKSDRPGAGLWLGDDLRLRGRRLGLEPVSESGGVAHVNGTSALDDMRQ